MRARAARMRAAAAWLMLGLWGWGVAPGCLVAPIPGAGVHDAPRAFLVIACEPPDASIYVDDEYIGDLHRWRDGTVPLPPGEHRIALQREGFYTYRIDLTLKADRMTRLTLELVREVKTLEDLGAPPPPNGQDPPLPGGPGSPALRRP